jgi:hypothetical protein
MAEAHPIMSGVYLRATKNTYSKMCASMCLALVNAIMTTGTSVVMVY